jgi:hypothetical protein
VTSYAFGIGDTTFGVFYTLDDEEGRHAHLAGQIPAALAKVASELVSKEPLIEEVTIIAVK